MAKLRKIMNIPNLMNIDMEKEANLEVFHLNINIWMIMNMKWYIALFMVNKLLEEGEIMRRSINNITLSLDRIFIIKKFNDLIIFNKYLMKINYLILNLK